MCCGCFIRYNVSVGACLGLHSLDCNHASSIDIAAIFPCRNSMVADIFSVIMEGSLHQQHFLKEEHTGMVSTAKHGGGEAT